MCVAVAIGSGVPASSSVHTLHDPHATHDRPAEDQPFDAYRCVHRLSWVTCARLVFSRQLTSSTESGSGATPQPMCARPRCQYAYLLFFAFS